MDDRFDDALGRAARSLVTERLPPGLLDPAVSESLGLPTTSEDDGGGRRIPGFAVAGAALVVLLFAAASLAPTLLIPGGSQATPVPSATAAGATPAFRSTAEIRADLELLGYSCVDGSGDVPIEPAADGRARKSAVCTAPDTVGPLTAVVIVGESAAGHVVEVRAEADIVGFDIPAARRSVAATFAKAVAVVVPAGLGNAVATWVATNVPVVEQKGTVTVELRGYALHVERDVEGSYTLVVVSAAPG